MAANGVIGNQGALPWKLPDDMARFSRLTMGHAVIMGRATFASLNRPLTGRRNIVLTRNAGLRIQGCIVAHSREEALEAAAGDEEVFVIGGAAIYALFLPEAHRLYVTWIDAAVAGDAVFPAVDWSAVAHHAGNRRDCRGSRRVSAPLCRLREAAGVRVNPLVVALCALTVSAVRLHAADWQVVETRHFQFIFEARDRPYVDELLSFCEDVYARVTAVFDSFPDKVPCILRGRRDDANGITWSFPSRIDLYVKAPTDSSLGARSESWLRLLLTHELTHFVHQSMPTGVMHTLSLLFGPDLSTVGLDLLPGWAIEGPAVYDETIFTQGGRGRNPLFEVYTKAAAEEKSFFSLSQAGYPSAFPPPERVYVAGYDLIDWMQETYGPETLRQVMTAYLDFPFLGPWNAIAKVTGESADSIYADMRSALEKKYAAAARIPGGRGSRSPLSGAGPGPRPLPGACMPTTAGRKRSPASCGWTRPPETRR